MMIREKIRDIHVLLTDRVLGQHKSGDLESRVLTVLLFLLFINTLAGNIVNIIFDLGETLIITTAAASVATYAAYNMSREGKAIKYFWPIVILFYVFLGMTWILSAGYDGNTLILIFVILAAFIVIANGKQQIPVFIGFAVFTLLLELFQYYYPGMFTPYASRQQRFFDIFLGTIVYLFTLFIILMLLKNNTREQNKKNDDTNEQLTELIQILKQKNDEIGKANLALQESEEKQRFILEATEIGIWDWNAADGSSVFSPGYFSMLGYRPNEFSGGYNTFRQLVHPDDILRMEAETANHTRNRQMFYVHELRMKTKSGQWRWILSRGKVVREDASGKIIRMVGVHVDINDLKKAEESLRFSEMQFRSVWENSLVGMRLIDKNAIIRKVNQAFCTKMKLKKEYLEGKTIAVIYMHEDGERIAETIKRNFEHQIIDPSIDKRVTLWNGEVVWFELSNVFLTTPDNEQLLLSIYNDITIRKNTEGQLVDAVNLKNNLIAELENAKCELEKINVTKDKFFSILAHDLKNPFFGILGYSELLSKESRSYSPERIQDLSQKIYETATKTYRLLENLLEWSRSQMKTVAFNPRIYNLRDRVVNSLKYIETQAVQKQILVVNNSDPFLNVFADANMLDTIIRNLLSNAIKFTRTGGNVAVLTEIDSTYVTITVADNGVGIEPDVMKRLFQLDNQTVNRGTSGEEGTGLGLIICREFVLKHSGRIWIDSNPGKGSSFHFTIPLPSGDNS